VASGRILSLGPWTVLTLHVFAALALVPFAVIHLLPRRWRVIRPPRRPADRPLMSRRTALTALAFGLVGLATWAGAEALDRVAGGVRRFTGSRWLPDGGIPPATTFFGESTRPLSRGDWRLRVHGAVDRPLELSLDELAGLGETAREEVLDCTSGWALRTTWGGVPLASVLEAAGAAAEGSVTVRAVTGWYAALPMDEARGAFLATAVAGRPLPHGNGAPCRLVAPNRRGLEWVKWVTDVEVT